MVICRLRQSNDTLTSIEPNYITGMQVRINLIQDDAQFHNLPRASIYGKNCVTGGGTILKNGNDNMLVNKYELREAAA